MDRTILKNFPPDIIHSLETHTQSGILKINKQIKNCMHCCIEKNLENELLLDDIDEKKINLEN